MAKKEFHARRFTAPSLYVALPEWHCLGQGFSASLADLRQEFWVGVPDQHPPRYNRWHMGLCRKVVVRPRIVQDSERLAHALSTVVGEAAVTLVPGHVKLCRWRGGMKPLRNAYAKWDFHVVWRRCKVPEPVKVPVQAL